MRPLPALFLGLVTIATLCAAYLAALYVLPRPADIFWIDSIYGKKEAAARAMDGPRLVLIGGSSTHFSYSARLIAEYTGVPAINFGSHAGVGTEYILYRAQEILKPGDIAILALEYSLVGDAWRPGWVLAATAAANPRYLLHAPWWQIPILLFGYSPFNIARYAPAGALPRGPLQNAAFVDDHGDETSNTPANKQPYMAEVVLAAAPHYALPNGLESVGDFVAWAKANDIRVLRAWPPTDDRAEYAQQRYREMFAAITDAFARQGVPTAGDVTDYLLPLEMMFNATYHADSNGQTLVSERLARDLCARFIDCPGPGIEAAGGSLNRR